MTIVKFGTPEIIIPLYETVFDTSTVSPSMLSDIPPMGSRFSPVAVTTTSASRCSPDSSCTPCSVNVAIRPVAIEASPARRAAEQVAVRNQAEPLVPGVVGRVEVRVDVEVLRQLLLRSAGGSAGARPPGGGG